MTSFETLENSSEPARTVTGMAAKINDAIAEAEHHARAAMSFALRAGELMLEAREQVAVQMKLASKVRKYWMLKRKEIDSLRHNLLQTLAIVDQLIEEAERDAAA